jgi:hypothetical protein
MQQNYWFLNKERYEPFLEGFAITEQEYLSAMHELTQRFPWERSQAYYREQLNRLGGLNHFNLIPYPNTCLPYNPVPILLHANGAGILSQLLYLGLALHDYKKVIGRTSTKALGWIKSETDTTNYRGALFEIEIGALLMRSGLKPLYRNTTPDYLIEIEKLPLGVEAVKRDVETDRFVAERLLGTLAFLDFKQLFIKLELEGQQDGEGLIVEITKAVEQLLEACATDFSLSRAWDLPKKKKRVQYRIHHELSAEKTLTIIFGKSRYEQTLSKLITNCLEEKEKKIRKRLEVEALSAMPYVVAVDIRSLLALPVEPEPDSEYEQQMAEKHRPYYDRLCFFRQQIVLACQSFTAQSPLIKGVLLWEGKRQKLLRTKCTKDTPYIW